MGSIPPSSPGRRAAASLGDNKRVWGACRVIFVAIDIGGTFTDLVGFDDKAGRFVEAKSLTTPAQLVQGIVDCIRKSGLAARDIDELIHGSTIAINTLIERKGAMPEVYLSLSHEILREYREFERMSTTVVNAYIGPKVGGYVKSLRSSLGEIGFRGDLSIMRSNGGVMTPEVATERPAAMMESGPVGGIIASARVGMKLGLPNVISFDMGGTTAKASLVRDGEPTLAPGYYVGGSGSCHPVMLPMIDVVEVGAGGGSIAWLDDVGALKVGPQSAG